MINAIIFDCFGVLTTDGWLAFKARYLAPGSQAEMQATELNHRVDAGLIPQDEFEQAIAELAGVDVALARQMLDSHVANDELFDYIAGALAPHYKIGLLSNVSADYTPELFTPAQNALFDARVFSYELGVTKPHPLMYQTIATKLDCLPEECVFVDDRELFVTGARDVGMQAIQFHDTTQVRRDLERMLH